LSEKKAAVIKTLKKLCIKSKIITSSKSFEKVIETKIKGLKNSKVFKFI
jgi:hypothetical protein